MVFFIDKSEKVNLMYPSLTTLHHYRLPTFFTLLCTFNGAAAATLEGDKTLDNDNNFYNYTPKYKRDLLAIFKSKQCLFFRVHHNNKFYERMNEHKNHYKFMHMYLNL